MSEIERIADQLQKAFYGPAWHGPAVKELLDQTSAAIAGAHPITNAHSIWQLVLHMTFWKRVVLSRLRGQPIEETPERDWPPIPEFSDADWDVACRELENAHIELFEALRALKDSVLTDQVPGKDYNVYVMLQGIVQHDLYHAGQIAVLRKAS